jgi:hypothetical protein
MFGEPRRERAGAAADVEDAAPAQVACANEQLEHLGAQSELGVTKLVVPGRECAEVGGATPRR